MTSTTAIVTANRASRSSLCIWRHLRCDVKSNSHDDNYYYYDDYDADADDDADDDDDDTRDWRHKLGEGGNIVGIPVTSPNLVQ